MSRIALMALMLLSLAGCAANGQGTDSFCLVAKPIYFSTKDLLSDRTERAIIAHNEKGAALCQWGVSLDLANAGQNHVIRRLPHGLENRTKRLQDRRRAEPNERRALPMLLDGGRTSSTRKPFRNSAFAARSTISLISLPPEVGEGASSGWAPTAQGRPAARSLCEM